MEITIDDWDELFGAVKARLRLTVGELPGAFAIPEHDATARVRIRVLECVEALEQLHVMLRIERSRRQQLELEVSAVRGMLVQTLAERGALSTEEVWTRHPGWHDGQASPSHHAMAREQLGHERVAPDSSAGAERP